MEPNKLQSPLCPRPQFKVIPKSEVDGALTNQFIRTAYLKYPFLMNIDVPIISPKQFRRQIDQTSQYKMDYVNHWEIKKPKFNLISEGQGGGVLQPHRLPEDSFRPNIRNPISALSGQDVGDTAEPYQHIDPKELLWGSIYSNTIGTTGQYIIDNKLHLIKPATQ